MEGERTVEMLFEAEFMEAEPALSPDGRWLAYLSMETDRRILVKPFPNIGDGQWNVSIDHEGVQPLWSPDGRESLLSEHREQPADGRAGRDRTHIQQQDA